MSNDDPLGLFGGEDDPLGLFAAPDPEAYKKDGYHGYDQSFLGDLVDKGVNYAKDIAKRVTDPNTYSKAAELATDPLQLLGNMATGGKTPPSASEEGAVHLGTGAAGFMTGLAAGPLTPRPGETVPERISAISDRLTYQPKTEGGKDIQDVAGEAINQVGVPLMGLHAPLSQRASPKGMEIAAKDKAALAALEKAQTEAETAKGLKESRAALADSLAKVGDANVMAKLKEADAQVSPKEFGAEVTGQINDMHLVERLQHLNETLPDGAELIKKVAEKGDQELVARLEKLNDMLSDRDATAKAMAEYSDRTLLEKLKKLDKDAPDMAEINKRAAEQTDRSIIDRLKGLDEVARDTERSSALADMQTKEIVARLERLKESVDGLEDMEKRAQNEDLSHRLEEELNRRGQDPIFVDPQGQAFRGDPNEQYARRALEKQGVALDVELTHLRGELLKEGEPLALLVDPLKPTREFVSKEVEAYIAGEKAKSDAAIAAANKEGIDTTKSLGKRKRKQAGGVTTDLLTLGLLKNNPLRRMVESKNGTFIPEDPTPQQQAALKKQAYREADVKSLKNMDSGAALTAMKRGSTAIKAVGDLVENAFKRADLKIRQVVFPVEQLLRGLSMHDLSTLGTILKIEMFKGERFAKSHLSTLRPDIQKAYVKLREGFTESLRVQNEARAAKGQKPITPVEAYLSSRWGGDFRRPIYDASGKLVWYLASDTKAALNAQTRALLKDHPDFVYDPKKDHTVRFYNRKTDLDSGYTAMIDVLGRDDPAVEKMRQYMEDQTTGQGASFLGQEKHFKSKGNIHGFIGDRPELRINDFFDRNIPLVGELKIGNSAKSETLALFHQQIQYMKNGIRWSELQKVSGQVGDWLQDPKLKDKQPSNMEYARDYWKHAIGYGEAAAVRALSDGLRDMGISPAIFDKGVGGLKSFFILQKLAVNSAYVLTQAIQLAMIAPHMMDMMVKDRFVANPIKAVTAGMLGGLTMGTGHIFNSLSGGMKFKGIPGADFFNSAYRYAEDNGITARSIYDESPIANSFSAVGQVGNALGKTLTVPETYMRSAAFMTLAQFLKDSGKYKTDLDVFREAERRTNVSMVDYAQTERPMVFAKLGSAGNFLNTLQTYSFNYYNQASYFTREAFKGNVLPVLAFLGVQYLLAGAMGAPGVEDIYKSYMAVKDMVPAKTWKNMQDNEFLREPKLWLLKNGGTDAVYGYLADKSGIGLTSRLAAPSGGQMLTSPAGPVMDIGKQIGSAASLAMDPTNQTKQAQAAMNIIPTGLQGRLETSDMMEGITHNTKPDGTKTYVRPTKLEDREGLVDRTPEDEAKRKWGFRSTKEVIERDVNYANKRDSVTAQRHAQDLPNKFYDAVRRHDEEDAADYYKTYVYITGKGISNKSFETQLEQEYLTDSQRAAVGAKGNVQNLVNLKRSKEIFDKIKRENPTQEEN